MRQNLPASFVIDGKHPAQPAEQFEHALFRIVGVVGVYREEGETAANMKLSEFERMIARATDGARSVDAMVYSFFRRPTDR